MRKLASNTTQATASIAGIIGDIRQTTDLIVQAIQDNAQHVESGMSLSQEAQTAMQGIRSDSLLAGAQIGVISYALQEQQQAMQDIAGKIADIADMSRLNADAALGISASAVNLDQVAQAVRKEVSYFKFAGNGEGDNTLF